MAILRSRENARVRRWHRLARESRLRRSEERAWIEGPHLVSEYLQRGGQPRALIVADVALGHGEIAALVRACGVAPTLVSAALLGYLSDSRTPSGIAAEIELPSRAGRVLPAQAQCVVLEGVQDPGNVGALLRSAAAFGVEVALLGRGCADPWSPRALRAGMGAQFGLRIAEVDDLAASLRDYGGTVVGLVPRGGMAVDALDLTGSVAWLLGGEGGGVSTALAARAQALATIPMPGGSESLNVAAAAAIALYEAARQRARPCRPAGLNRRADRS